MTTTVFGTELKNKLLAGIKKLNQSVSSTLGPGGRTVLIKDQSGEVKVTKDGVTVAKSFHELEDQVEDLGAQLVKQVSIKSANEASDGTTTATLLATTMVEEGLKLINSTTFIEDFLCVFEANGVFSNFIPWKRDNPINIVSTYYCLRRKRGHLLKPLKLFINFFIRFFRKSQFLNF